MNGADHKPNGENHIAEQLPTPATSPRPNDAPSSTDTRGIEIKTDGLRVSNGDKTEVQGALSPSSPTGGPSMNDETAVLSDTSERSRPIIKRPGDHRRKSSVSEHEKVLKLSPRQIQELTSEPASIPIRAASPIPEDVQESETSIEDTNSKEGERVLGVVLERVVEQPRAHIEEERKSELKISEGRQDKEIVLVKTAGAELKHGRPALNSRSVTTPGVLRRKQSSSRTRSHTDAQEGEERRNGRHFPPPLNLDHLDHQPSKTPSQERQRDNREMRDSRDVREGRDISSPISTGVPLPPFSIPTFLSLELSADRPSPLYIYRPATTEFPYESSKIKYERLVNFLMIPPKVEGILGFGALACLDAWMHVLTILPIRFLLAIAILIRWWGHVALKEIYDIWNFVYSGLPRVWRRRRHTDAPTPAVATPADEEPPSSRRASISGASSPTSAAKTPARENEKLAPAFKFPDPKEVQSRRGRRYRHRRTKSTPSALLPSHKADILKGLLVIASSAVLMRFDASRMYHGIRGQSAIKLYVIYNVLEVCDRLLSAVGQDVLECLFSRETLDRNPDGRSKVIRPFWMFVLALVYNVAHATALFYQVITLNVAVNSYSNALLTLLLSNQFVEIKGTVFKKFEKENLFQITCADIVERFQLWLMLLIIAMRNIVEVGGLSIRSADSSWASLLGRSVNGSSTAPMTASSILPMSFTIFPKWIAQVLNPFLLVLGSEMVVDWLKHAYITKFNQTKPEVYGKFLDVLAKDYYSNAFTDPNLTRRLGLPVIPLSCLFIRAAIQTYHMFIATHMPIPFPSVSTSLTSHPTSSPSTTAALAHIDHIFRRALGRSSFGAGSGSGAGGPSQAWYQVFTWNLDDLIAGSTMLLVFLIGYLVFLVFKLVLGMLLLTIARNRYHGMKERERLNVETGGKRIGGWGVVDVDEEKRRWIYNDDPDGLRGLRERDEKNRKKEEQERERGTSFGHVERYKMVAKRIW